MCKCMFNPPEHINFYCFSNILIVAESPNFANSLCCKVPLKQPCTKFQHANQTIFCTWFLIQSTWPQQTSRWNKLWPQLPNWTRRGTSCWWTWFSLPGFLPLTSCPVTYLTTQTHPPCAAPCLFCPSPDCWCDIWNFGCHAARTCKWSSTDYGIWIPHLWKAVSLNIFSLARLSVPESWTISLTTSNFPL